MAGIGSGDMPEIDPTFTALPYRELGAAALGRAQELGATHADFRFERMRYQHLGVRDGVLQRRERHRGPRLRGAGDPPRLVGVRLGRGADPRRGACGVAETAVAVAEVAAEMTSAPVEIAPEPVYDDVTWVSSYDVNPLDVPTAEKAALLIDWTERLRQGAAVDHATASVGQVQENKYYADLAGTVTTQQRVRVDPDVRGDGRRRGHLRLDGEHRAPGRPRAGSTSPTASTTGTPSSTRSPSCSPRSSRRRASRPAATTWSSTRPTCG